MNNEELERVIKIAIQQAITGTQVSNISLSTWLLTYRQILSKRGYAVQTIKNRSASIKHIEVALGKRPITSIKPFEISNLLDNFSAHNATRILGELRDMYHEAVANGVAQTNPAIHIKAPKQARIRKRLALETWDLMLERSFNSSISWTPHMLLLALATGQRRGDLVKMRFDDIVDGCLRVEQQKKAGKPMGARLAIPLDIRLKATGFTLREIIEFCKMGMPGATLLRKSNGGSLEASSLSARFHELLIGVVDKDTYRTYEHPSLHEVRSLSARTYMSEGMLPDIVQTLLGHKHEDMTKVYLDDRGLTEKEWKLVNIKEYNDTNRSGPC